MKQALESFSKALLEYQTKLHKQEGYYNEHSYLYFDRLTYIEHEGLYDITWYTGDYGFQSTSKTELETARILDISEDEESLDYFEQGLDCLLELVMEHPDTVRSLSFLNPHNNGYNGTANWDFIRLAESEVVLPNLQTFKVQLYEVGDHNYSVIGDIDRDGNKQVTQLLAKMPNLVEVQLPTPPDADFFKMEFPKLQYMKVQGGYDSKNFIKNLAKSPLLGKIRLDFMDCLLDDDFSSMSDSEREHYEKITAQEEAIKNAANPKAMREEVERQRLKDAGFTKEEIALEMDKPNRKETLRLLRITEETEQDVQDAMNYYDETGRWLENGEYDPENDFDENYDDFEDEFEESATHTKRTSFEDYQALVTSTYVRESWHFTLREHYLAQEELIKLHKANPNMQFLYVPTPVEYYLSHKFKDNLK